MINSPRFLNKFQKNTKTIIIITSIMMGRREVRMTPEILEAQLALAEAERHNFDVRDSEGAPRRRYP